MFVVCSLDLCQNIDSWSKSWYRDNRAYVQWPPPLFVIHSPLSSPFYQVFWWEIALRLGPGKSSSFCQLLPNQTFSIHRALKTSWQSATQNFDQVPGPAKSWVNLGHKIEGRVFPSNVSHSNIYTYQAKLHQQIAFWKKKKIRWQTFAMHFTQRFE